MTIAETAPQPTVKVGDFFYSSWGYDQTNVDFFKVVGLTPKGVRIQHWSSLCVRDDGGPSTRVVPGDAPAQWVDWSGVDRDAEHWVQQGQKVMRDAKIETKRLQVMSGPYYEGRVRLAWKSYADLYLWDGTPKHQTGFGWGH